MPVIVSMQIKVDALKFVTRKCSGILCKTPYYITIYLKC